MIVGLDSVNGRAYDSLVFPKSFITNINSLPV